jgi:hypothetical protein
MKKSTAASLIATMTALNRALSRTPTTSSTMMKRTITAAGRLKTAPGTPEYGPAASAVGSSMPKPWSSRCM